MSRHDPGPYTLLRALYEGCVLLGCILSLTGIAVGTRPCYAETEMPGWIVYLTATGFAFLVIAGLLREKGRR